MPLPNRKRDLAHQLQNFELCKLIHLPGRMVTKQPAGFSDTIARF